MFKSLITIKHYPKRVWNFLWNEDSLWSWLANIAGALVVIRFLFYPLLGILLGTSFPIVAVVSESMEHGLHRNVICGEQPGDFLESFPNFWKECGDWYEEKGITSTEFRTYPFPNGFRKGDVIILWRANAKNIQLGDVLVFQGDKPQPIIHRVVRIWKEENQLFYQTKGDHNSDSLTGSFGETKIKEERIYGKGLLRIPYLGWIKIVFVDLVELFGIKIAM